MCGIAAAFGAPKASSIIHMLKMIKHRGEDNTNIGAYAQCILGINRLSIVDVQHGNQPFSDPSGTLHAVCNGEIYNHREIRKTTSHDYLYATESDSEVILSLYDLFGTDCVQHLDGMFAFFLCDERRGTFMAARDRFGIKPLYYLQDEKNWYFASEAKAFLGLGLPIERIEILPPGCFVTPNGVVRWYHLDAHQRVSVPAPSMVRVLLEESVKKHLMTDPKINVGTYLSGGLDSSIVTALAAKFRPDITAFTIGVDGSPDLDASRRVAAHLGIRHVAVSLDLREVREALPSAIYSIETYNQIALEGLMSMMLARTARQHGVKVVLCGEGADEIFAGYGVFRDKPANAVAKMLRETVSNINNTECLRLDRATMAYSLEARVPFLDPALVEYGINLPVDSLIRADNGRQVEKWILRKSCEDLLPADIIWRMKMAFDHGSGILALMKDIESEISDEDLATARREYPEANVNSKLSLHLFRLWRCRFGRLGGTNVNRLFGHYPVLQAALDARTAEQWGTGESEADLQLLNAATPFSLSNASSQSAC